MRWVGAILSLVACGWAVATGGPVHSADASDDTASEIDGYLLVDATGVVHTVGGARSFAPGVPVRGAGDVAVSLASRPDGEGYTVAFGDGSLGAGGAAHVPDLLGRLRSGERVAATRSTPDLVGSWTVTTAGRVIMEGTATHHGDLDGVALQADVIDLVPTSSGNGYWLVAGDGGVFAFGDASFHGSMGGQPLNAPVVDLVPDPDGDGYWLVAADGGVFAFEASFVGSLPGVLGDRPLNAPIAAGVEAPGGYVLVGADGGVFVFAEDAPFLGSFADQALAGPIVDIGATYAIARWEARGTFIDDGGGEGPRLCFSVQLSLPPGCGGGPRAVGLDWEDVEDVESSGGVTWGRGTFVIARIDAVPLADAVRVIGPSTADSAFVPRDPSIIEPMCDTLAEGWTHLDPSRVSLDRFDAALGVAQAVPGHGNGGVGEIVDPGPFPDDEAAQDRWFEIVDDPFNRIVVVRHVGDPAPAEAAIRREWGGPVCVLPARSTLRQLFAAQESLFPRLPIPNLSSSGIGWFDGLTVGLVIADGVQAEDLARELAPVATTTSAWFQPVLAGSSPTSG